MSERQKLQKACLRREPGAGTLALCLALPTIAVPMSAGPKNVAEGTGVACGSRGTLHHAKHRTRAGVPRHKGKTTAQRHQLLGKLRTGG